MVDVAQALQGAAQHKHEVSGNEFVQQLIKDKPSEVLPFPRNGADGKPLFEYRCEVLTQRELDGCLVDAEDYTMAQFKGKKTPKSEDLGAVRGEAWTEVYNNAKIVEVLQRSCRQVTPKTSPSGKTYYDPLFIGTSQIRTLLTTDELAALFNAYRNTQFKFGPLWRILETEEVDAIVERLEGGLDLNPILHWEPEQHLVLVASLAARNRRLRTGSGSFGEPAPTGADETPTADGEE